MKKYKILRLITWLPVGGIERKIAAVLPRLNRDRFEVHLCCIRERGVLAEQLEAQGIPVHLVPFRSRMDPRALAQLGDLVRRLGIDLIHSHMYRSNTPATLVKMRNPKLKVVGHYHNVDTWESWRQRWMDARLARRRDMNVAVSEAVRHNVVEKLGLKEEQTTTLYNCVDLDVFKPMGETERKKVRDELGVLPTEKLVIVVARMVGQKNHDAVLQAARELQLDEVPVKFLLVGDGPRREELENAVLRDDLSESVIFTGRRDDVPRLLAASDVFLLPSLKEGFSNAVLEAMACGLPCVVSDVGGNAEVVDTGKNGYVVEMIREKSGLSVNQSQMMRNLRRLLNEEDHRTQLAAVALSRGRQFDLDAMVREIENLYLELLEATNEN